MISSNQDLAEIVGEVDECHHLENEEDEGDGHANVDVNPQVVVFDEEKSDGCSHDKQEF